MEETLQNLLTDDLLAKHGLTGLSPQGKQLLAASVLVALQHRLSQRLLASLTPEQLAHLESLPAAHKDHQLDHLARGYGMPNWVEPELDVILTQIAAQTR